MPTALELTSEERKQYRPRPAPLQGGQRDRAAQTDLLRRVQEVADEWRRRFGVRRVVLFGSLAHGAWFTDDSDVDLAVEGLTASSYWEAWRIAEEALPDRAVDVVEIESASSSLLAAIERYGVAL